MPWRRRSWRKQLQPTAGGMAPEAPRQADRRVCDDAEIAYESASSSPPPSAGPIAAMVAKGMV